MSDLFVIFFSRGGSLLVGLALQSLLAWQLGPEGRGIYALCLIFSSLAAAIFTLGIDWAVNYYVSTRQYSFNRLISFSILYYFISTLLLLILLPFVTGSEFTFFKKTTQTVWFYSAIWSAALMGFAFCSSILSGMREFSILARVTLVRICLTLLVTLIFFKTGRPGVTAPILADMISCFFMTIVVLFLWMKKLNYRWDTPDFLLSRSVFSYGLRFFGGSLGMIANARIGTILLAFYVDNKSLGFFALSMSFLAQMITISDVTARIIQPRIAESSDGRPELVSLCSRIILVLVVTGGLVLVLTSTTWIPFLFSAEFLPIRPILAILMPGIWLRVLGKILFPYFNGINRPEVVSVSTCINLIVNIALLLILLAPYGLKGAALAATTSYGISTAYAVFKYVSLSGQSVAALLIPKVDDHLIFAKQFVSK